MKLAEQALSRVDIAMDCARTDARNRRQHLEAALSATGDLQRALILEQLHSCERTAETERNTRNS